MPAATRNASSSASSSRFSWRGSGPAAFPRSGVARDGQLPQDQTYSLGFFSRRYPGIKVYGGGDKVAGLTNLVRFLLVSISGQGTTENEVGSSRSRAGTGQRQRYLQDWISRRQGRVHPVPVSLLAPAASGREQLQTDASRTPQHSGSHLLLCGRQAEEPASSLHRVRSRSEQNLSSFLD